MTIFDHSPRARWLLTLSAFGVACGQPTPPSEDAAASSDATTDRVVMSDASAQPDAAAMDVAALPDSAPDATSVPDASSVPDAAQDASVGAYPAGPYGSNEGQTLEDLQIEGYLNASGGALSTMSPFGPVSMQSLRQTGRRFALVHTSATY
jgi:hypothetical protein